MGRIIKALILGWIGKKIYDRVQGSDEEPVREVAHSKPSASKGAPRRRTAKA